MAQERCEKLKLTETTVKAAAVPAGPGQRLTYWDSEIRGFGLRVTSAGVKSWVLKTIAGGKQAWITLGKWPELKAMTAREMALDKLQLAKKEGTTPQAARRKQKAEEKAAIAFSDFAARYITDHIEANNRPSWAAEATRLINKHILPALGKMAIKDVGPADISALLFRLKDTPTQANRVRAVLRTMFSRAEAWEIRPLGSNPVAVMKRVAGEVKRDRRLSDIELKALGEALRGSGEAKPIKVAIRMAVMAGMRKGEILGLRWEWVDKEAGEIRLPPDAHKTGKKTGKSRIVHLCSALVADLKELSEARALGNPYVFAGKPDKEGRPRHLENLQAQWERIRVEAKLAESGKPKDEDPGLHDLRRTFASVGADLGLKGFVGELIGHAEKTVTDIYTRAASERLKDAAEAIGTRIGGLLSGDIDPMKEAEERRLEKEKRLKGDAQEA